MKIVDISIKQPVLITMVMLMLVVLGSVSYNRVGVDLMPDVTLPIIAVSTVDPGVGPEEIESQITKPIEDAVSSINGIDKVSSTSSEGVSIVTAQFVLEKNAQQAEAEVRDKVSGIRNKLPSEIQEPIYNKFDPSDAPVLTYNITSRKDSI